MGCADCKLQNQNVCSHTLVPMQREFISKSVKKTEPCERLLFSVCRAMIGMRILFYVRFLSLQI